MPKNAKRTKLTKRLLDSLSYDPAGPQNQFVYDAELPGFGVRLHPTGAKTFFLRYSTQGGRERRMTLGSYGAMTLPQAREKAREARLSVYEGADPLAERQQARKGNTLKEFTKVYLDRHAKPNTKTWRETERRLQRHVLPALGTLKLEEIRRSDVANLHAKVGERGRYEANRILATLSHMFNAAIDWGFMEETAVNPAARVKKYREKSRDRWIKPEELPELTKAIEAEPSPYTRALFKLFLLTGCRRAELCGLRWSDVDLNRRELRFEDTKAGRSHVVPLSEPAVRILEELPGAVDNPYVFPGPKKGTALQPNGATQQWLRIRERAGLEDVRLHDLRRTVGSWLASDGASLPLIGKVLNHSNASTTQVYARLGDDAGREALERHARKVIPIEEARRTA